MNLKIENSWKKVLEDEFEKNYFKNLMEFLNSEYENHTVYPPKHQLFNAFHFTPFEEVKVVILGQDPYHGAGQANGLSFSVSDGVPIPPSLKNIFKELHSDLHLPIPFSGNLENWAKQGVFLLNATLSVQSGKPASHQKKGWEIFTDTVIQKLANKNENLVFILWGNPAHKKVEFIDSSRHFIIQTAHPSPLSAYRGFFGSKVFSKTNQFLKSVGKPEINWIVSSSNTLF
ncbi:MAG: uracil-DNA glycosylase [Weeksellaceae bacterium]|jgi:uracil-DNA glycosylase|nr:uracil-DNA glycosylase [Weeksellaceae bacterium]MDX9705262.1 uracil-DNA glycosylase [Weeksellaceae bacterium]